jgi:hypothetical protein
MSNSNSQPNDNNKSGIQSSHEESNQDQSVKQRLRARMDQLEMMAFQKEGQRDIDFNSLAPEQKDKMLALLDKNETNAFQYHNKRLDVYKDIESQRIQAGTVNQRSFRIVIWAIALSIPILTILILFFKENFFISWLTFITGLAGGFGLSKLTKSVSSVPKQKNEDNFDEEKENTE